MKALVYTDTEELTYRDEPDPSPASGDALVAIEAVGVCGSDMHAVLGHDPRRVPPLILGHEAAGRVVGGPRAGEQVVLNPLITCGACPDCLGGRTNLCSRRDLIGMRRAGAFAERITIPERNLIAAPAALKAVHAALTEPAATALHALALASRAAWRPLSEGRAMVIGGGSVGLFAALMLHNQGCRQIDLVESNPLRRATASATGVCEVRDPAVAPPQPDRYELVVDAVGGPATRSSAILAVRPGGVIVHIGLMDGNGGVDARKLTLSEITLIGCYTYTPVDLQAALDLLASGALGTLEWVETRPLSQGGEAFADLLGGRSAAPKVVLEPAA